MTPDEPEEEIDEGYREAFSGLFGEAPQDEPDEATPPPPNRPGAESGPVPLMDEVPATEEEEDPKNKSWVDLEPEEDTGAIVRALSDTIRVNEPPLPEEDSVGGELTGALELVDANLSALPPPLPDFPEEASAEAVYLRDSARDESEEPAPEPPPERDGEDNVIVLGLDEEPGGQTQELRDDAEEVLGHAGEDAQTRAMSESDVDDVLRDMERRVREIHAASPHDTQDELVVTEAKPLEKTVPDAPQAGEGAVEPASTATLLDAWIRKNATAAGGVHFEPVGALEPPRRPVRPGAALEIGVSRIRYLELTPYESGRQVATRYEHLALAESASDGERIASITAALAALQKRAGDKLAPCTVLHEQGAVRPRLLTVPAATRALNRVVASALGNEEPFVSDKRVMGRVRVGSEALKSVLVSYAPRGEIRRIEEALRATETPVARITSTRVSFLETMIGKAARLDEDAAEAFVLIERTAVTVALAARGVLLLARIFPLEKQPGSEEWGQEVLNTLREASNELERACGGGELSRIRYLTALPKEIEFPVREIVVVFGRPAELVDPELLFRIDLESVQKLGVPPDAVSLLSGPAYEATLGDGRCLDLGARGLPPIAPLAAWGVAAAALLCVLAALLAWQPRAQEIENLKRAADERAAEVTSAASVKGELEAALRLKEARAAIARDRAAIDELARKAPDLAPVLRELGTARVPGTFFERVEAERLPDGVTWSLELTAVGTGDRDKARAATAEVKGRLEKGALRKVAARVEMATRDDELPVTIGAIAGGDK